jgi:nucleosome binding factor SPN SPT16 subunit
LFQSGGKYDFRMSAVSNDDALHGGVIVCSVGARYSFYCSNISRTIFINPTKKQVSMKA